MVPNVTTSFLATTRGSYLLATASGRVESSDELGHRLSFVRIAWVLGELSFFSLEAESV